MMTDFFTWLYELINYKQYFAQILYGNENNPNLYVDMGWALLGTSIIIPFIFYYVINHPRFNRWYHWLICLVINLVANFGYMHYELSTELEIHGDEFSQDILNFSLINLIWAALIFVIISFIFRLGSRNNSRTPFPL